jgi:hypothetical protein
MCSPAGSSGGTRDGAKRVLSWRMWRAARSPGNAGRELALSLPTGRPTHEKPQAKRGKQPQFPHGRAARTGAILQNKPNLGPEGLGQDAQATKRPGGNSAKRTQSPRSRGGHHSIAPHPRPIPIVRNEPNLTRAAERRRAVIVRNKPNSRRSGGSDKYPGKKGVMANCPCNRLRKKQSQFAGGAGRDEAPAARDAGQLRQTNPIPGTRPAGRIPSIPLLLHSTIPAGCLLCETNPI